MDVLYEISSNVLPSIRKKKKKVSVDYFLHLCMYRDADCYSIPLHVVALFLFSKREIPR